MNKYGQCEDLENTISAFENTHKQRMEESEKEYEKQKAGYYNTLHAAEEQCEIDKKKLRESLNSVKKQIEASKQELASLQSEIVIEHYNFSDYDGLSSEDCKNKLALLRDDEKKLIKSNDAVHIISDSAKKVINDNVKQILRCFNSECDNILMNLSVKNIE